MQENNKKNVLYFEPYHKTEVQNTPVIPSADIQKKMFAYLRNDQIDQISI